MIAYIFLLFVIRIELRVGRRVSVRGLGSKRDYDWVLFSMRPTESAFTGTITKLGLVCQTKTEKLREGLWFGVQRLDLTRTPGTRASDL